MHLPSRIKAIPEHTRYQLPALAPCIGGAVVLVLLALLILPEVRRRPQVAMLAGIFALALSYMLGQHTPVHWLAFHLLPGAKVQRTIAMGSFVFAFAGRFHKPICGPQRFLQGQWGHVYASGCLTEPYKHRYI